MDLKTFLQHVVRTSLAELEKDLGYASHPSRGLTMAGDRCVSYHSGELHGQKVYYVDYSAIEYVFTAGGVMPGTKPRDPDEAFGMRL